MPARGQGAGEQQVTLRGGGVEQRRAGEAGVPPAAAEALVGKGALETPSRGLRTIGVTN